MTVTGSALVRSKLLLPSVAGLLHRPRVCQAIKRGLACKLTLVSAPAGYGKTSALVDLAQRCAVPVCWYTADERDRDLGLFVQYLVGAIGERFPGFGERTRAALASSASDLLHDPAGIVGDLVNEMLALELPFGLVVDNYEAVDGALGIRAFLRRLLEVLPPNCHLMLGSRVLPDVPVTQLVAQRQLVGLTAEDLRFDAREIQDLLALSNVEVSAAVAEAMAANSEGWITGVLLLVGLAGDEARAFLFDGGSATAATYDYLAAEVLSRQPPHLQQFLRTSSVLREMSARLCRDVLGTRRARGLLAAVERRNLFITRFGSGGAATYRYHNLFREFLHEELRQRDASRCAELHLRAAERFEQADDIEEAVHHYLAAEAYSEATALMERAAKEWFARGRVETLLGWADALPEEVRGQAPRVLLYQSKVLTDRYAYEGAGQALAYAERGFLARGDTERLAAVHNQRAAVALLQGRYEDAIIEAQNALEVVGEGEAGERASARGYMGRACVRLGRLSEGVAHLQDAVASFRQAGSAYNVVNALQDLSLAHITRGRPDEAVVCLNEALSVARRLGARTRIAGVLNDLGWAHYLRGEYERALALYEDGLTAARRGADLRNQSYVLEGLADLYRDVGAYERAERLYEEAWRIAQGREPTLAVYILAARADMCRWQGDHERAQALLSQARRLVEEKGLEFEGSGAVRAGEGILCAESGEAEAGIRLLCEAVRFLERRGAKDELVRSRFLLAKAHFLAGDDPSAVAELRRAMELGDEMGTCQFAAVEGQHTEDLLRLGVERGVPGCLEVIASVERLRVFGEGEAGALPSAEEGIVGRLEISALGKGQVVRDGDVITSSEWQTADAKELFFYVLLHGPLERDAIGVALWPELSTKRMINRFHVTLHRTRRALGGDAVVVDEGRYDLNDLDYWFDVEEFEGLVERARLLPYGDWQAEYLWERAAGLYQGDFLPEVGRDWCVPKREALREMYLETLIGLGRCHEARRHLEGAVEWYKRALGVDELREDVHRRIMECYAESGHRARALAQYRYCREILAQELGVDPSIETERLRESIAGERLV